jgi:ubiquitin-like-conjugating enzyme ATG10
MEASVGKRNATAEEYLMIWIGALGNCVGLNVPLALMQGEARQA